MLKNPIPELALFYDLEWVPDAAGAKRLFDLPDDTTEIEAMQRLWEHAPKYNTDTNPRPFLKYMFSRVVSIASAIRGRCNSPVGCDAGIARTRPATSIVKPTRPQTHPNPEGR